MADLPQWPTTGTVLQPVALGHAGVPAGSSSVTILESTIVSPSVVVLSYEGTAANAVSMSFSRDPGIGITVFFAPATSAFGVVNYVVF